MSYVAPDPNMPAPVFYPVPPGCGFGLPVGGTGAYNVAADVAVVQHLLNGVATADGGPTLSLAEDGLCGLQTVQAIIKSSTARNQPTDTLFPNSALHNMLCFYSSNAGLMPNPYGP
jgi:hypothetical protein